MRRLKTYEAFGSFNWDDFCQTIKDLFMDLYDKEYTIELFPPEYVKSAVDDGIYTLSKEVKNARIEIRKLNNDQPLWTNGDEKMDFDAIILDILRYVVSEGYTYECKVSSGYTGSDGILLFKINLITLQQHRLHMKK
jgi:hypothetical protein